MKQLIACLVLCLIILSGCSDNNSDNAYSGIEEDDITSAIGSEISVEQMFKGNEENWAATYYVYKNKNNDYETRLFLKYLGEKPYPTGQVTLNYDLGEAGVGTKTQTFKDTPENAIYMIFGLTNGKPLDPKTIIKVQASFSSGDSAYIELKSNS